MLHQQLHDVQPLHDEVIGRRWKPRAHTHAAHRQSEHLHGRVIRHGQGGIQKAVHIHSIAICCQNVAMCTYYEVPGREQLVLHFGDVPEEEWRDKMSPLYRGPFLRAQGEGRELVVGQWGMIRAGSATRRPASRAVLTNNARIEGIAERPTYRGPWAQGQRCLILADWYQEPNWETGKNIWWRLRRADGEPWALAGLWSEWTDPQTGELVPNFTMITCNCDGHPLLGRLHKPDPTLPPDRQDKRAVAHIDPADWSTWLRGAQADAQALVVVARMGEGGAPALFLVEAGVEGMEARSYPTIDGRSAANISFDGVRAVALTGADQYLDRILANAIIVQCAEAVGAMGALVSLTSEYAMTRKQFGMPIAGFQAVAHRLADMKIAYNKARATLLYTAALAESGATGTRDIAILKGQTGKLGRAIGEAAIQTHGGVGMTDELSVSHYHKHLLACDAMFGDYNYYFRKVGQG